MHLTVSVQFRRTLTTFTAPSLLGQQSTRLVLALSHFTTHTKAQTTVILSLKFGSVSTALLIHTSSVRLRLCVRLYHNLQVNYCSRLASTVQVNAHLISTSDSNMKFLLAICAMLGMVTAVEFADWHSQGEGFVRSPCPALNSLANRKLRFSLEQDQTKFLILRWHSPSSWS